MADLLGKIKGKIDKGISKVNVKSKEIIEKQKIKLQISELEAAKKIILLELGELTHLLIESSGTNGETFTVNATTAIKSQEIKPDKWEELVLNVLESICEGKLDSLLFESTEKDFKITAKALSAEVQKSLPKSEQKGQNLQWLGRVLGKFEITSRKYSKRINHNRETVYEFNRENTLTALKKVKGGSMYKEKDTKGQNANYKELMMSKSNEINALDTKITKLEEKLSNVGT